MHVKNRGRRRSNFQDLPKKRNPRLAQHNFFSPVVRMSSEVIKDNYFVNLERMKTTENATNTFCFNE